MDTPHAAVRKVDLGIFGDDGCAKGPGAICAVAGSPFFEGGGLGTGPHGMRGASKLLDASEVELQKLAIDARGTWAAARYEEESREVVLLSDRCGVRPLYWWTDGIRAAFSSTIRALAEILSPDLQVDVRAVFEECTLGYALSDRTGYMNVRRIGAGQIVRISPSGLSITAYAPWPMEPAPAPDLDALARSTLDALQGAIELRLGHAKHAVTFLSGGMDSRAINALLHEAGAKIHAFTFSPETRLDGALARAYAEVIGADHVVRPDLGGVSPSFADSLRMAWSEARSAFRDGELRARLPAWSGDGGSVCGGAVYVTPPIVRALREGDMKGAVQEFLRRFGSSISRRDVVAEGRAWIADAVTDSILEELDRLRAPDPVLGFLHFLVQNDQRRHLDCHHEGILEHGIEFWLPFFDTEFLRHSFSVPVEASLGHGFYARWFDLLPQHARSVAWQTYPEHVPCPLPPPQQVATQWEGLSRRDRRSAARQANRLSLQALAADFPSRVFSRSRFLMRFVVHHLGLRDSGAAFRHLATLNRYRVAAHEEALPWREATNSR